MPGLLDIYLRDHEAGGVAGLDLFRRAVANSGPQPYAAELRELAAEVETDLRALRDLMDELGVRRARLLPTALRIGERLGRLKPNGRLLRRSELSDLIEVEALLDAVRAKEAGWRALSRATRVAGQTRIDPSHYAERAASQSERLLRLHGEVAGRVLGGAVGG